jgi:Spy/CpxP family protein refolding chaperone
MKLKLAVTMSILAAALQLAPAVFSQDQERGQRGKRWEQRLAGLSPEERQKIQAARQKAMQDPAVQASREKMRQAHKEFRDAMHAAMLKADPSIQPVLDKIPKRNSGAGF